MYELWLEFVFTMTGVSSKSLRNLAQYKDLSDEEWEEVQEKLQEDRGDTREEFENRIQDKISEFERDYDLSDMKFNDTETLRALCQAMITLEDFEQLSYRYRDFDQDTEDGRVKHLGTLREINNIVTKLRQDISSMQEDLKISRKIRKSDRELSVRNELAVLKEQAREFYESKMSYIYCDKCMMLLSTVWFTFPHSKNRIQLTCGRINEDGTECGNIVDLMTSDLLEMKGINVDNTPDF